MSKRKTVHPKRYCTKVYIGDREVVEILSVLQAAIMVPDPQKVWSTGEQVITKKISESMEGFSDI